MPAILDDQQSHLNRIDNELAAACGLRERALLLGHDGEYEWLEFEIDRLKTVRAIITEGGLLR
jgi:hypothetical protein